MQYSILSLPFMRLSLLAPVLMLAACASTPQFNMLNVQRGYTPQQLTDQFDNLSNQQFVLGGTIINSTNTKTGTQLEILAYPLDGQFWPEDSEQTDGRIIATYSKYLETIHYAPGRKVSLIGTLTKKEQGNIGDATYIYPLLEVTQIHLWEKDNDDDLDSQFHFGIGVMFRR